MALHSNSLVHMPTEPGVKRNTSRALTVFFSVHEVLPRGKGRDIKSIVIIE